MIVHILSLAAGVFVFAALVAPVPVEAQGVPAPACKLPQDTGKNPGSAPNICDTNGHASDDDPLKETLKETLKENDDQFFRELDLSVSSDHTGKDGIVTGVGVFYDGKTGDGPPTQEVYTESDRATIVTLRMASSVVASIRLQALYGTEQWPPGRPAEDTCTAAYDRINFPPGVTVMFKDATGATVSWPFSVDNKRPDNIDAHIQIPHSTARVPAYDIRFRSCATGGALGDQVAVRILPLIKNVRMRMEQAVDANCDGDLDDPGDTAYSAAGLSAAPGQCIAYRITARNDGTTKATNINVVTNVPKYTGFDTCAGACRPTADRTFIDLQGRETHGKFAVALIVTDEGNGGQIKQTFLTLEPRETFTVTFTVKINE